MRLLSVFLGVVAVAMWGCGKEEDESAKKQFDAMTAVFIEANIPSEEQKKLIEEAAKLNEEDFVKKFANMIKAKYMDKAENFKKILNMLAPGDSATFESMKDDAAKQKYAEAFAKLLRNDTRRGKNGNPQTKS